MMDKNQRNDFQIEIQNSEDAELCNVISNIFKAYQSEKDSLLKMWQKTQLIHAVSFYFIGWFNLCRATLLKSLEPLENISKATQTIENIKRTSSSLTDEELLSDIKYICVNGSVKKINST